VGDEVDSAAGRAESEVWDVREVREIFGEYISVRGKEFSVI